MKQCNHCKIKKWDSQFKKGNKLCFSCSVKQKAYHEANKERRATTRKAYYEVNKEKIAATVRAWREANPDKATAKLARYRASKLQRTPPWSDHNEINEVYAEAKMQQLTVDHIVPLQGELVSGLHVHNNLQLLTAAENSGKCNYYEVA